MKFTRKRCFPQDRRKVYQRRAFPRKGKHCKKSNKDGKRKWKSGKKKKKTRLHWALDFFIFDAYTALKLLILCTTESIFACRAHRSPAEISTFFKSSGSQRLHSSAPPRPPPPSPFSACTSCRCVSYLMSSSKSHSHWCLKCNLVSCSACVFFSSCVTLTWRNTKTGKQVNGANGSVEGLSLRCGTHFKLFESSAVSFTCLTATCFYY